MAFSLIPLFAKMPKISTVFQHCIEDSETWSQVLFVMKPYPKHFGLSPSWIGPHGCSILLWVVLHESLVFAPNPAMLPSGQISLGRLTGCSLRGDARHCQPLQSTPLKHAIVRWTRMHLRCSSMNTLTIQMTSNVSSLLLMKC